MKLGIFANTFPGKTPLERLTRARDAGFEAVHYNLPEIVEPAVAEAGVEIVSVSGTYNMIHPDRAERVRGQLRLRNLASASRAVGVRLISLCTGTRDPTNQWKHHPDNRTPDAWRDLLESMATAIEIAEEFDIQLGIEPELANVVNSAVAAHRLIAELASPRVRVILDAANLFEVEILDRQRQIVAAAIDLLSDKIVMSHAKDRRPDGAFTTSGHGVLDYPHYIRCLRSIEFDGPLVAHGLAAAEAPAVATFLRSLTQ